MSSIDGIGWRPWLDSAKLHYVLGLATRCIVQCPQLDGYIPIVLVFRWIRVGGCVFVLCDQPMWRQLKGPRHNQGAQIAYGKMGIKSFILQNTCSCSMVFFLCVLWLQQISGKDALLRWKAFLIGMKSWINHIFQFTHKPMESCILRHIKGYFSAT